LVVGIVLKGSTTGGVTKINAQIARKASIKMKKVSHHAKTVLPENGILLSGPQQRHRVNVVMNFLATNRHIWTKSIQGDLGVNSVGHGVHTLHQWNRIHVQINASNVQKESTRITMNISRRIKKFVRTVLLESIPQSTARLYQTTSCHVTLAPQAQSLEQVLVLVRIASMANIKMKQKRANAKRVGRESSQQMSMN
jgi:hypothetical protein